MNLMTGSTSYAMLQKKYDDFLNPSLELTIDSTKLVKGKEAEIEQLQIDLTSGFEASGCEFVISSCYDNKKNEFDSTISTCLQVGAKAEIEIGYRKKKESVFTGYVDNVTYEFSQDDSPKIRVRCMDAKGILMKNRRLEVFREKRADAVVSALLSEQPVSGYLSGKTVDRCSNEDVPLRSGMKTDYDIVREQAEKMGFEFFIIQGKAYFQKAEKNKTPVMTLEPSNRILEVYSSVNGNPLVETIEVRSIDDKNGKLIQGSAAMRGKFSKGMTANKLMRSTAQVFYEAGISSAAEAKKRATVRMEAMKSKFGSLELTCVGIPELVPGRYISLSKFSSAINGKYYVTNVTHDFTESSYTTTLRARRSSI
ncbi:MAG: hypothetical protein IJ390_09435 [Lachnospiraceae bacterium]|nr:hypothetical protein [Lachnospiraceae bacterium]